MKRVILLLPLLVFAFLASVDVQAQAPPAKFNYQAVARKPDGTFITGAVTVKIEILDANNVVLFTETQGATANAYGLFSIEIGKVNTALGSVPWANGSKFVRVTVNNVVIGNAELLSVPYALYAGNSTGGTTNTIRNGTGIPGTNIGNDGDYYIDNTAKIIYGPKAAGVWPSNGTSMVGTGGGSGKKFNPGKGIKIDSAGNTVTISNTLTIDSLNTSAFVKSSTVPGPSNINQVLVWDGNLWSFKDLSADSLQYAKIAKGAAVNGQVLKLVNGVWQPSTDQGSGGGTGIIELNKATVLNQQFVLDTAASDLGINTNTITGDHTFSVPVIGKNGAVKGLLSNDDYKLFKAGIGTASKPKVGSGLAVDGANKITLKIGNSLDTIGGILRVRRLRLDSVDITGSKESNILKVVGGKLVFVTDSAMRFPVGGGSANYWDSIPGQGILHKGNVDIGTVAVPKELSVYGTIISDSISVINGLRSSKGVYTNFLEAGNVTSLGNISGKRYTVEEKLVSLDSIITPKLKVTGGVPAPGKVLTSDSRGNATWEDLPGGSGGSYTPIGGIGITPVTNKIKVNVDGLTIDTIPVGANYVVGVIKQGIDTSYIKPGKSRTVLSVNKAGAVTWLSRDSLTAGGTNDWTTSAFGINNKTGNVGIGVPATRNKLSVNGGINIDNANTVDKAYTHVKRGPYLTFGHDSSGEGISSLRKPDSQGLGSINGLDFFTKFETRMTISQNGFVGIGTTMPQSMLHVGAGGEIRFDTLSGTDSSFVGVRANGVLFRMKTPGGSGKTYTSKSISIDNSADTLGLKNGSITKAKLAVGAVDSSNVGGISINNIKTKATAIGQVLKWDGTKWTPSTDNTSGGGGALSVKVDKVTIDTTALGVLIVKAIDSTIVTGIGFNDLPKGTATGQILKYNGTKWVLGSDLTGSGTSYTGIGGIGITTSNKIKSNVDGVTIDTVGGLLAIKKVFGTSVDSIPLTKIAKANAAPGQILKWDGTKWTPSADNSGGGGGALSVKVDKVTIDTTALGVLVVKAVDSTIVTGIGFNDLPKGTATGQILKYNGTKWVLGSDLTGSGTPYTGIGGIGISANNKVKVNVDGVTIDTLGAGKLIGVRPASLDSTHIKDGFIGYSDLTKVSAIPGDVLTYIDATTGWKPKTFSSTGNYWTKVGSNEIHLTKNDDFVGIGTLVPNYNLDVVGVGTAKTIISVSGSQDAQVVIKGSSTSYSSVEFLSDVAAIGWGIGRNSGNSDFYIDRTGGGRRLTIGVTTGFVGIGTVTTPLSRLHVGGGIRIDSLYATTSPATRKMVTVGANGVLYSETVPAGGSGTPYTGIGGIGITTSNKIKSNVDGVTIDTVGGLLAIKKVFGTSVDSIPLTKIAKANAALGQILKWDGTKWTPSADNAGGGGGTLSVKVDKVTIDTTALGVLVVKAVDSTIVTGIGFNDLPKGTATGQILKYNGTKWVLGSDLTGSGTPYTGIGGIGITASNKVKVNYLAAGGLDTLGAGSTLQIAANGVTSAKILDGTIVKADLLAGTIDSTVIGVIGYSDIPTYSATSGQVLSFNGTTWKPATITGSGTPYTGIGGIGITASNKIKSNVDGVTIDTVAGKLAIKKVFGTSVDSIPLTKIAKANASLGQILKWDGTKWTPSADNAGGGGGTLSVKVDKVTIDTTALGVLVVKAVDSTIVTGIGFNDLPKGTATGQILKYNGTKWVLGSDLTGSGTPYTGIGGIGITASNKVKVNYLAAGGLDTLGAGSTLQIAANGVTSAKILDGTIVKADLLAGTIDSTVIGVIGYSDIPTYSATSGQVLSFNGTTWKPATITGSGTPYTGIGGIGITASNKVKVNYLAAGGLDTLGAGSTLQIAANGVTSAKILDGTIVKADLLAGTIDSTVIGVIGYSDIPTYSATSGQVLSFNGTTWKPATITGSGTPYTGIGGIGITASNKVKVNYLSAGGLDTLGAGSTLQIAANGVTSAKILDGTIVKADLLAGTVDSTVIGVIGYSDIPTYSATSGQVLSFNGTSWKPATISGSAAYTGIGGIGITASNKVKVNYFATGGLDTLGTGNTLQIAANGVTSAKILNGTIVKADILAGTVDSTVIGVIGYSDIPTYNATSGQVLSYNGTTWRPTTIAAGAATLQSAYLSGDSILISANDSLTFKNSAGTVDLFTINSAGKVAIGGKTFSNATLAVYGNMVTGNLSAPSDIRYKKNVSQIGSALETVQKLTGVSYNWRRDEFPQMNFMEGKDLGLIAQEVEKVLPELVMTDDKGFKTVRYTQLIPVLLEAIKEQQKQIEALKTEVSAKDSKVQSSESRIQSLESSMKTLNSQMQLLMEVMGSKDGVKASK